MKKRIKLKKDIKARYDKPATKDLDIVGYNPNDTGVTVRFILGGSGQTERKFFEFPYTEEDILDTKGNPTGKKRKTYQEPSWFADMQTWCDLKLKTLLEA